MAPEAPPLSPECSELLEFMSKKSHGDLLQYLPEKNITLQFVWVQSYVEFSWNKWQERLFGGGPAAMHYDALLISVGLWDMDQFAGGRASLSRHCTSISVVVDFFLRTFLPQDRSGTLASRILVWGIPFSEPFVHPLTGHSLTERFPWAWLQDANECVKRAMEGTPLRFLNTSTLLQVPSDVYRVLEAQSGGTTPGADGRMLTLDGYHPSREVRAILLDELLGSVATAARWRRKHLKSWGGGNGGHGVGDGGEEALWNVLAGGALGLLTVLTILNRCTKTKEEG